MTREQIETEALLLPAADKAYIVERLLGSLQGDAELEQLWAAVADRRIQDLDEGRVTGIPADEAMRQA